MQFKDIFCYAVLTITMAATCVEADSKLNELEERQLDRRMSRRTATVLVDGTPVDRMFQKPKVIYRRISKKRYPPSRTTRGPPRPKYGPPRSIRKPAKKYRGKVPSKHTQSNYKKRAPKPRYGPPPKRPTMKPVYGPPKSSLHHFHYQSEQLGFGEPPNSFTKRRPAKNNDYYSTHFENELSKPDLGNEYSFKPDFNGEFSSKPNIKNVPELSSAANEFSRNPFGNEIQSKPQVSDYPNSNHNYGEPPVDSYGAPIKPNLHDLTFSTSQSSSDIIRNLQDDNIDPEVDDWENFRNQKPDNNFAYSKKHPAFSKPDLEESEVFVTPVPQEDNDEQFMNSYSEIYNYRKKKNNIKKNKKVNYLESVKMVNKPWKGSKMKMDSDEDIIVGGQYAEPPARYVPKFKQSASMHDHDDDLFSPPFSDPDAVSSASMSSYVNYKNSNMAFSPQNLNDAFSIVK